MSDVPSRFAIAPGLLVRHWAGESTGVVFSPDLSRTHLVSADAVALLQGGGDDDAWPAELIDGLLEAGLLRQRS